MSDSGGTTGCDFSAPNRDVHRWKISECQWHSVTVLHAAFASFAFVPLSHLIFYLFSISLFPRFFYQRHH